MPRRTTMLMVAALVTGMLSVSAAQAAVTVENGSVGSFDGTLISYTIAHPDGVTPSPVIFYGHGWGGSRTTTFTSGIQKSLLDAGFAVLSWDARGFGTSGGEANVDSQQFEVRDVQALIDEVSLRSDILMDGAKDPRMGMIGGSYAGGIQLMTAAADSRVDAIVPQIAWNDLPQSLKPGGVLKLGWDLALYGLGAATGTALGVPERQTGALAPQIHQSLVEGTVLNDWTTSIHNWFDARSPKHYINGSNLGGKTLPGINAPTLILQGFSDTLFNFNQGLANYEAIAARGVPAKLIGFCGGHTLTPLGTSCTSTGASAKLESATLTWLDKYVAGNGSADTGAAVEYQLQDGSFKSAAALPDRNVTVGTRTVLTNTIAPTTGQGFAGTAGGCRPPTSAEKGAGPGELTPSEEYVLEEPFCAGEWLEVAQYGDYINLPTCKIPGEVVAQQPLCDRENYHLPNTSAIVGVPRLNVAVKGTGLEAYAFFKLVDYNTATKAKTVIDDQVTAHKFTGLGSTQEQYATIDMAGVSWEIKPGHLVYLEVTSTSNDHASSRTPSSITMDVSLSVPVTEVEGFISSPASFNFGTKAIGPTFTTQVKVTSTGTADVTLNSATLSGADASDFQIVNDPCSGGNLGMDAEGFAESCYITVGFSAATAGAKAATLTIDTSAGSSTVALTGTAQIAPFNSVSPASVAFGEQTVATSSAPTTITVTNAGSATMNITTVTIAGTNAADFSKTAGCASSSLAVGASCSFDVTFTPAAAGSRTGRVTINSNGGNVQVQFTGTGVAA